MAVFNITYQNLDSSLVVQPIRITVNDKNTVGHNFLVRLDNPEKKGFIEVGFIIYEFNKENEQYNKLEIAVSKEEMVLENDNYECRLNIGLETCYGVLIFKYYVDEDGIIHEVNREYNFARFEKAHEEMEAVKNGEYVKKSYLEDKPAVALVEKVQEEKAGSVKAASNKSFPLKYKKVFTLFPLILAAITFGGTMAYCLFELLVNKVYAFALYGFYPPIGPMGIAFSITTIIIGLAAVLLPCIVIKDPLLDIKIRLDRGEITETQAFSMYRKGKVVRILLMVFSIILTLSFITMAFEASIYIHLIFEFVEMIKAMMKP